MSAVSAVYVRTNHGGELLPNGVIWATQYKTEDGTYVYAVDYHRASGETPSTTYATSKATYGLIPGTKLLVDVEVVDGIHYATKVGIDENAEYRECPRCSFMGRLDVTGVEEYLDALKLFQQLGEEGIWEITKNDVPDDKLVSGSDEALLEIRCLECRAEYGCRTSGEREAPGIHYAKYRHSYTEL